MPRKQARAAFRLSPTQAAFWNCDAMYPLFVGGFGSGKSFALRRKFFRRLEQNCDYMGRDTPAFYLAPTYDMVDNLIGPTLEADMMRLGWRRGVEYEFSKSGHLLLIKFKGRKCYTRLLSSENYQRYMGSEPPFICAEELDLCFNLNMEKKEAMWRKLVSRTDRSSGRSNTIDIACTPEGLNFLWEYWEKRPKKDETGELSQHYVKFHCSTYENERNLGPNYIPKLKRDYPKQYQDAYLNGRFVPLSSGLVYFAFDRSRHVTTGLKPTTGLPIEFSFDFNTNPCTCVVSQYVPTPDGLGDLLVFDCIQDRSGKGTEELCRIVAQKWGWFQGPALIYGDATGTRSSSSSAGKSDRSIIGLAPGRGIIGRAWERKGFETRWEKHNPWPPERYAATNSMLYADRIAVNEEADGLLTDWERQPFKPGTRQADDLGRTVGHAADAFGYRILKDLGVGRTMEERMKGAGDYGVAA